MLIATVTTAVFFLAAVYALFRSRAAVQKMRNDISVLQKHNETLSAKAELLSLAGQISNLGTWEFFIDEPLVKWSEELSDIYGFEHQQKVVSRAADEEVIAPEYRDKVRKELQNAILNKSTFAVEYQIIQAPGSRRYVLGQGFYIEKDHKLVGTVLDITEQKEAIFKLKINETLLREAELVSHNGSWEWSEDKEYALWSDEMYNIHGFLPHSVFVSFSFYQSLVHEDDQHFFLKNFSWARQHKEPFKIGYRIVRPSGEVRHVLSTAEYKKTGINSFAYIGNTQDVTELREAEVQLEEKVAELKRSNQDLEQFAYVASHDLQEPLRKIQAFGEKLLTRYVNDLNPEAQDYLKRMGNAAGRMRTLINDLLAFSRATRDHKNFQKVSLSQLIREALRELELLIENRQAVVSTDLDLEVEGIAPQLRQLFQNLLENAFKFTGLECKPEISIQGYWRYGHELFAREELKPSQLYAVVHVKDNGIGFGAEDAEKIFEIFHRLHSRTDFTGTGIGLAICKKITDNHSGIIYARSEKDKGAEFTVILPKKQLK